MLRAGESNYLAFNDVSLCNRLGIDGGAIESWGTGELPRYRCHLGCILLKMAAISLRTGGDGIDFGDGPPAMTNGTRKQTNKRLLSPG